MKILWVKAGGLVPLDVGGKIRSYQIIRELSRKHEVTLFTFYPTQLDDSHHELRQILSRVVCVPLPLPASRSLGEYADYIRRTCSFHPYTMAKYYRPEVFRSFNQLRVSCYEAGGEILRPASRSPADRLRAGPEVLLAIHRPL